MQQHILTSKLLLPDSQAKRTKTRRKTKAKPDPESKKVREIERSKVLRALASSAIPLTVQQIKAVTGKISRLKLLMAYLKHQRLVEVAFRAKSPNGPYEEDYYRIVRPSVNELRK